MFSVMPKKGRVFSRIWIAKRASLLVLLGALIIPSSPALALDPTLKISGEQLVGTGANTLSLAFSLTNTTATVKTVSYSLDFRPKKAGSDPFRQVVAQNVSLSTGTLKRQDTVPTPHFLIGDYTVYIEVTSSSGTLLAESTGLALTLQSYTSINLASCSASGKNLASSSTFSVTANTSPPSLSCVIQSVSNVDNNPQDYTVVSFVNENSLSGKEVGRSAKVPVTLTGNAQKTADIPSYIVSLPAGNYVLSIEVRDKKSDLVGNPIVVSMKTDGASGKTESNGTKVSANKTDKTAYLVGETAIVTLSLAGYDPTQNTWVVATLSDEEGVCGTSAPTAVNAAEGTAVKILLERNCNGNTVATTLSNGRLALDKNIVAHPPETAGTANNHGFNWILIVGILLAVLLIVGLGWYFWRRYQQSKDEPSA